MKKAILFLLIAVAAITLGSSCSDDPIDQIPTIEDSSQMLIKYDSVRVGGENIWKSYWKLNCKLAFGDDYTGTFQYRGDKNNWNSTALAAPVNGWLFFTTEGTQRFSIVNMRGGTEFWARVTNKLNESDHSLTKWNSFGAIEVVTTAQGTFPVKDMGSIGDHLISLSNANGKLRINVRSGPGTFMVTAGMSPGLRINFSNGQRIVEMIKTEGDPFGLNWHYEVDKNEFNQNIIFSILPNASRPEFIHFWSGSYWSPNSVNKTYSIPVSVNPPW